MLYIAQQVLLLKSSIGGAESRVEGTGTVLLETASRAVPVRECCKPVVGFRQPLTQWREPVPPALPLPGTFAR